MRMVGQGTSCLTTDAGPAGATTVFAGSTHLLWIVMGNILDRIRTFFRSDRGIAVTEYGLLIALVAVALVAAVMLFGTRISAWFTRKTGQITTV